MTTPALAPRSAVGALVTTWVFAVLASVAVGVFAPFEVRFAWMAIAAGATLIVAFAANLWTGRSEGFIVRTAGSVLGGLLLMGFISLGFALAAIVPS
ncbi:hypothetical protein [Microbacterium sp. Marseille-Q6965]|uniref:hypothetical protein n=1 Tax=Microbacterium sp. Marseille-Q6965 TaxID=2965072 RepID=UPI0021B7BE6C|nr:hypothetical protein [Microbacterium sp. Marseille-Q6965]